jgi:hypothetical protein
MQNGFFDIVLGDSISNFPNLDAQGPYEKKKRYRFVPPILAYGSAKFVFVDLLFYKNRLHSIYCRTEGQASTQEFLATLQALFGPGVKDGFAPRYRWEGQQVVLTFDENIFTHNAEVVFVSKTVQAIFRKDYIQLGP